MMEIKKEEVEELLEEVELGDEHTTFIEEALNEAEEIKKSFKDKKILEYFSNNIIVFSFTHTKIIKLYNEEDKIIGSQEEKYFIYQVYDREKKENTYHYCKDKQLQKSLLLNLINKGDSSAIRKNSF